MRDIPSVSVSQDGTTYMITGRLDTVGERSKGTPIVDSKGKTVGHERDGKSIILSGTGGFVQLPGGAKLSLNVLRPVTERDL